MKYYVNSRNERKRTVDIVLHMDIAVIDRFIDRV